MSQRTKFYSVIGLAVGVILIFWIGFGTARYSCEARGFRLPAGNYEAGLAAFVELGCSSCHSVAGLSEFDRPAEYEGLLVPLGGELRIVKTYGELVTAIIHPTESIRPDIYKQYVDINGKSLMPDLTWQMSARQVIDMVAFLEEHYEVMTPEYPANYYPYGGAVHP